MCSEVSTHVFVSVMVFQKKVRCLKNVSLDLNRRQ
jgi:hypothetical protein